MMNDESQSLHGSVDDSILLEQDAVSLVNQTPTI
jgi:hypothetical protein